jgi:predicted CXXCH cytochrome family protein
MSKQSALRLALACAALVGAIAAWHWLPQAKPMPPPAFAGTMACAGCHQQAYLNWQQSHHRHAMEAASAESVLGNFNDTTFDHFGTASRFFTRDGRYFVETDNARGELETFRVTHTFGWYPLQQYLIDFPDGRKQALSISWDSRPASEGGQRWFHLYPEQKVAHDDPLHWTGSFQNWNSRCAFCHSTNLVRNYSPEANRYDTRWQDMNVGCEACHGPGSQHVAWAGGRHELENQGLTKSISRAWSPDGDRLPIPPHTGATMSAQLQTCAACHSRRGELQQASPTAEFFDNFSLGPLLDGRYFPDGQMREEVYEVGSFLQSRMHANQVSCTNCHEPHSGELRARGNALCLQCHQPQQFQTKQHFFHEPASPGAQCVNCHMPKQTYMGVDERHDHSFRVPDPAASVALGVPNACTQCHTNRNARWAAEFLVKRSGSNQPRYAHAAMLTAARKDDAAVATNLLTYARNESHPAILRSIALLESGRFASREQTAAINEALRSPDPLVRMGAASALGNSDARERLGLLKPLLTDPARAVRNVVARELIDVPQAQAPADLRASLGKLFEEYQQTLQHNADMPESMSDLALYHAAQGDPDAAERALTQARKLAPHYLPAMLNQADLYRARSRDDLGEALLREALAAYPESGDVHHMLGLLYVRTGRTPQSVPLLQQAAALSPANAQYALVHALALIETGQRAQGMSVLQQAVRRFPESLPLRQTLDAYQSGSPN